MDGYESEYYCVELTLGELSEISTALNARIKELTANLAQVHSIEAKSVLTEMLQNCINAQKETTHAGRPEKYMYGYEQLAYPEESNLQEGTEYS